MHNFYDSITPHKNPQYVLRVFVYLVRRKGMSKPPVKLGVDKSYLIEKERTS